MNHETGNALGMLLHYTDYIYSSRHLTKQSLTSRGSMTFKLIENQNGRIICYRGYAGAANRSKSHRIKRSDQKVEIFLGKVR